MSDMLTKLSISVSGKAKGKEALADLIAQGIVHLGGTIPQRKGDPNGQYLTVELAASTLAAIEMGRAGKPVGLVYPMGGDVEIRDGVICAKVQETTLVLSAGASDGLLPLDKGTLEGLIELHRISKYARLVLGDGDVRVQAVKVPDFVDGDRLKALLMEGAQQEIERCDAALAKLGFRYAKETV